MVAAGHGREMQARAVPGGGESETSWAGMERDRVVQAPGDSDSDSEPGRCECAWQREGGEPSPLAAARAALIEECAAAALVAGAQAAAGLLAAPALVPLPGSHAEALTLPGSHSEGPAKVLPLLGAAASAHVRAAGPAPPAQEAARAQAEAARVVRHHAAALLRALCARAPGFMQEVLIRMPGGAQGMLD